MSTKRTLESFVCRDCNGCHPAVTPTTRCCGGEIYLRNICRSCESVRKNAYPPNDHSVSRTRRCSWERDYIKKRRQSTDPRLQAETIKIDAKGSDRKRGWKNDLTTEWVQSAISKGCIYCGCTTIKMTLDRISNEHPHTQENVLPACIRCNLTRKNMPFSAWEVVAKGMRTAFEAGLFSEWTGGGNRGQGTSNTRLSRDSQA